MMWEHSPIAVRKKVRDYWVRVSVRVLHDVLRRYLQGELHDKLHRELHDKLHRELQVIYFDIDCDIRKTKHAIRLLVALQFLFVYPMDVMVNKSVKLLNFTNIDVA